MKCPKCGTENPEEFNFCENCGVWLDIVTCPSCSHENPRDFKFCEECGYALVGKVTNAVSEQVSQSIAFSRAVDVQPVAPALPQQPTPQISPTVAPVSQHWSEPAEMRKPIVTRDSLQLMPIIVRPVHRKKRSVGALLFKTVLRAFIGSVIGFFAGKLGVWVLNNLFSIFFAYF